MSDKTPPFANDMGQLWAQLREIVEEKTLLDIIEEDLDHNRSKEYTERVKKRKQKDMRILRERAAADQKREARQDELVELENALRVKLKARKSLSGSPSLTHTTIPNTRSRDDIGESAFSIPQSWLEDRIRHKRPRTAEAKFTAVSPQSPKRYGDIGRVRLHPLAFSSADMIGAAPQNSAVLTGGVHEIVTLPHIQSLPSIHNIAELPAFMAMPDFTRVFITEFIGGVARAGGLVPVGKDKRAVQIVACDEYMALQSAFNPYLPSAPGRHGVFLDLKHPSEDETEITQRKVFPLFLSTEAGRWYYSGHYTELLGAEKIKETIQRRFLSEALLNKWIGSIFADNHRLTDFGLEILHESNLYEYPEKWNAMTKEKVKLAIRTMTGGCEYTQLPFWFRFLQCVRFDHAFHGVLIAKKQEINARLEDDFEIATACGQPKADVATKNHRGLQQRGDGSEEAAVVRTLSKMGRRIPDIRATMQTVAERRATEADLEAWNGYVEDAKARVRSQA
ncbi:MAG: hypothetical protein M1830_002743 [Pleopsidium flavum]|nr:MAG: hypothetical protein M1830_002743 [Pleopsidium flavum]